MENKYHYVIDVIDEKSPLKIGGVYHSEAEKNERINELLEGGWDLSEIKVTTYFKD